MARKFSVIEADGRRGPQVKKSVAFLLIRRLVAVREPGEPFTIRKLRIPVNRRLPEAPCVTEYGGIRRHHYEHHVEPKLTRFTIADSEWLRYLYGYR